jgi:hypothetical protein
MPGNYARGDFTDFTYTRPPKETMLQPTLIDHGFFIEHNMPCAVCLEDHAAYSPQIGVFGPCYDCQAEGWKLSRTKRPWWAFWR